MTAHDSDVSAQNNTFVHEVIQPNRASADTCRTLTELKDLSNPKVLHAAVAPCGPMEKAEAGSPPPSPPTNNEAPNLCPKKDTPRSHKAPVEVSSGFKRSICNPDDDVHSAAPTPCGSSTSLGRRISRERDRKRSRRFSNGTDSEGEEQNSSQSLATALPKGMEKTEKGVLPDNRHKGPCSYELCPNPSHSSGGGFKIVTNETKAGHRSWAKFVGRVFCNACFTQYATRGTFERPGRQYGPVAIQEERKQPLFSASEQSKENANSQARSRDRRPGGSLSVPLYKPLPCVVDTSGLEERFFQSSSICVELSVVASGRNLRFQWLRDGQRIPGATDKTLVLQGAEELKGSISCRLSNEFGSAPLFTPIRLPLSPEQALLKYDSVDDEQSGRSSWHAKARACNPEPEPSVYALECVCGRVSKGSAAELAAATCTCGKVCCGRTWPVHDVGGGDSQGEDSPRLSPLAELEECSMTE